MVVFACGACGESLKKNQVETHYYRKCRNCNVLSCLDCGKDFWGNEYEAHTKCISEEEKYSGKNYVPKPGSNKNEIKQQTWVQQVQDAVDKCKTNPRLKGILIRLKDQPNIPRKKNKFLNFLANGFHVKDPNLGNQVWDMLMTNTASLKQEENMTKNEAEKDSSCVKQAEDTTNGVTDVVDKDIVSNGSAENGVKLSKRDKKEERRKKAHKTEKKDKASAVDDDSAENGVSEKNSKKKKKRKDSESLETNRKSKKRKREEDEDIEDTGDMNGSTVVSNDNENDDDTENEPVKKKFKTKFSWNEVVTEVLQTKGPELKIKKLRKKVLSEYLAQGCTEKSEEKLWAKFDKKLKKIPGVKIVGDKVKLKNSS